MPLLSTTTGSVRHPLANALSARMKARANRAVQSTAVTATLRIGRGFLNMMLVISDLLSYSTIIVHGQAKEHTSRGVSLPYPHGLTRSRTFFLCVSRPGWYFLAIVLVALTPPLQIPFLRKNLDQLGLAGVIGYDGVARFDDGQEVVLFIPELMFGLGAEADVALLVGNAHARKELLRIVAGASEASRVDNHRRFLHCGPLTL